jgi:hypothetical protein
VSETTTAQSSSVLITTRAWIERRHTVAARRSNAPTCTAYCTIPAL